MVTDKARPSADTKEWTWAERIIRFEFLEECAPCQLAIDRAEGASTDFGMRFQASSAAIL